MTQKTPGKFSRNVIIDFDSDHSDPIKPLTSAQRARLEKIRDMYVKAGIISKPTEPEQPPQTSK